MESIPGFLSNQVLFVTGATGFVGKAVVVQALRHVPDIACIYIPVRERKLKSGGIHSAEKRLGQFFQSSAFDVLRKEWGEAFDGRVRDKVKAVPWKGLEYEDLGLDPDDRRRLQEEVDIVISSAKLEGAAANIDAVAMKRRAFTSILEAEALHLGKSSNLLAELRQEIAAL